MIPLVSIFICSSIPTYKSISLAGRKLVPGQRKAEVMHKRIGRRYLVPDSESENDDENDDENTMQCEEVNWDGGRTHNDMYKPYEFSGD